jgi:hypothetical protein
MPKNANKYANVCMNMHFRYIHMPKYAKICMDFAQICMYGRAQIHMDFPIENMQEKNAKICKEISDAKYAEVHFFSYFACICTPHFADVQVELELEDADDIHWRASLGTVTAGRARARGLLLVAWSLPVTRARRVGL